MDANYVTPNNAEIRIMIKYVLSGFENVEVVDFYITSPPLYSKYSLPNLLSISLYHRKIHVTEVCICKRKSFNHATILINRVSDFSVHTSCCVSESIIMCSRVPKN